MSVTSVINTATQPSNTTFLWGNLISYNPLSPSILSLPCRQQQQQQQHRPPLCALKTGSSDSSFGTPDLLRKPIVSTPPPPASDDDDGGSEKQLGLEGGGERNFERGEEGEEGGRWVNWEDKILEDTVPLVGFVRMVLHSGKYRSGDRLCPEHERTILERLLPNHPEFEKKVGCGVDYITIGYHPQFEESRCLFIVRKDGELVDFSYWKCIKGLIRKKYPLYADNFILKHFRRRRRYE